MPLSPRPDERRAPPIAAAPSRLSGIGLGAMTLVGSWLLFQVQPLLGKAILPWFGGTPAMWTTAMLFFQCALVAGYGLAFATARFLPASWRSVVFIAAAALSLAALPILPGDATKPPHDADPTWQVLRLLLVCIGGPYVVLAASGPTVQEWFVRAYPGRSPYRLFALSNLGSLVGLLSYPLIIEATYDVPTQAGIWQFTYWGYVAIAAGCGVAARRHPEVVSDQADDLADEAPTPLRAALWVLLSCGGSVVLLATTSHLCQDVAATPLLWVAPLSVYLLTFIISFDRPAWYYPVPTALAVIIAAVLTFLSDRVLGWPAMPGLLLIGSACLLMHGELSRLRPAPRHATGYYLAIAVGGALGGVLIGVAAPLVFDRYWEWLAVVVGSFGVAGIILAWQSGRLFRRLNTVPLWTQPQVLLYLVAAAASGYFGYLQFPLMKKPNEIDSRRNFYGVTSVLENLDRLSMVPMLRELRNGNILHGAQLFQPGESNKPTCYYGDTTGIGLTLIHGFPEDRPRRVGVVGLGVGTIAAYGVAGDEFCFYEINPTVVDLAQTYFSYLRYSAATCEVVLGDARLSLAARPPQQYDVLALDAFSSDAIPMHLLTVEAFDIYLRHLKPDGILALHATNRHVDLRPLAGALAEKFSLTAAVCDNPADESALIEAATWILFTRRPTSPAWRALGANAMMPKPELRSSVPAWTDAHSSLLPLLH